MLAKLVALIQSKVALAVVGVALVGGGGTAVAVAATGGHIPLITSTATATKTATNTDTKDNTTNHAHTVAVAGVLKGYDAGAHKLSIQTKDVATPTTVMVNADTKVNGDHATSLADLTKNIGHSVQVQADKQSDGSLLAWKVTVQGLDKSSDTSQGNGSDHGTGSGQDNGDNHGTSTPGDQSSQRVVTGTVASVSGTSFNVTLENGTTTSVSVTDSTKFAGMVHTIADLKTGMRVAAGGVAQADGSIIATVVEVSANA